MNHDGGTHCARRLSIELLNCIGNLNLAQLIRSDVFMKWFY